MSGPNYDREAERIEEELCDPDLTEADRKILQRELRDLAREANEQEAWENEGAERGWR